MKAQNLDKLSEDAQALIAVFFEKILCGWTLTYMVEVRLDNPAKNLMFGGHGLETHGGNGSKCYAKHMDDPQWAVVHCEDEDWQALDREALLVQGLKLARLEEKSEIAFEAFLQLIREKIGDYCTNTYWQMVYDQLENKTAVYINSQLSYLAVNAIATDLTYRNG